MASNELKCVYATEIAGPAFRIRCAMCLPRHSDCDCEWLGLEMESHHINAFIDFGLSIQPN